MDDLKDRTDICKCELFSSIISEAMTAIVIFDETTDSPIYCNKLARELLEIPSTIQSNSFNLTDLFPPERSGAYKAFGPSYFQQKGIYQELIIQKYNKHLLNAYLQIHLITTSDGHSYKIIMFQDMTFVRKIQKEILLKQEELKKAYEELLSQNRKLKELDIAKNRFFALTTHELRTPLAAIVAASDILVKTYYDNDEERDEFIKIIHEESLHLSNLINDILDFTKLQVGKTEFYVEWKSCKELVLAIVESQSTVAQSKNITLRFDNDLLPEGFAYFDPMRLRQIVTNVVANALKFTPHEGCVEVELQEENEFVCISVRDSGPGIAPEWTERIFDEFTTMENLATHHQGTGLGLPISKRLIEAMGGSITVDSTLGSGATFSIKLPTQKILPVDFYRTRADENQVDLAAS